MITAADRPSVTDNARACHMTYPHTAHRWDAEDREPLRYECPGRDEATTAPCGCRHPLVAGCDHDSEPTTATTENAVKVATRAGATTATHEEEHPATAAIRNYLTLYTLPANYPTSRTESHADIARRCAPLIAAHLDGLGLLAAVRPAMHEHWETTTDVEALREALRWQGHVSRELDARNRELLTAALPSPTREQIARRIFDANTAPCGMCDATWCSQCHQDALDAADGVLEMFGAHNSKETTTRES